MIEKCYFLCNLLQSGVYSLLVLTKVIPFMKKKSGIFGIVVKVSALIAGALLLFKNKNKLSEIFKNRNFIVAMLYGLVLSGIAVVYRLIMALNWIIQQAAK